MYTQGGPLHLDSTETEQTSEYLRVRIPIGASRTAPHKRHTPTAKIDIHTYITITITISLYTYIYTPG